MAREQSRRRWWRWALLVLVLAIFLAGVAYLTRDIWRRAISRVLSAGPNEALVRWFNEPGARDALATAFDEPCPGYPFLVPTSGFVGGLPWNAPYGPYDVLNPHPGIDIFGRGEPNTVPVRAAYGGFLTREADWISSVIIRHDDPLNPGETIWTYYTHMANLTGTASYILPTFPPGTADRPVQQGDLLGYQGIYNGGPQSYDIAMHLHFSIVQSDADGSYRNEAVFYNTLDPTPYLGLPLNNPDGTQFPLRCLPPAGG